MRYSEAKQGRTFVVRLEDGEIVHQVLEDFARQHSIKAASLIIIGGADTGSTFIVGPEDGMAEQIVPVRHTIDGVHEISGTGTIFPDDDGNPSLHMHMAGGRLDKAMAGCIRSGVKVWHVMEVIIQELTDSTAVRQIEDPSGFMLLQP